MDAFRKHPIMKQLSASFFLMTIEAGFELFI